MSSTIADLPDGGTANPTDRIPIARPPYNPGDNAFITPAYLGVVGAVRERLTADRNYFVKEAAAGGSDASNGLTFGTAFATIQKAIDIAATLDLAVYRVNISVAAGTYTGPTITTKQIVGGPGPISFGFNTMNVNIIGGEATPANVRIICNSGSACIDLFHGGYHVSGFILQPVLFGSGLRMAGIDSECRLGALIFDASPWNGNPVATHRIDGLIVYGGARFYSTNKSWTFKGTNWYAAINLSYANGICYSTIAFPDGPTWAYACVTLYHANFEARGGGGDPGPTGTATGMRFKLRNGAVMETWGGGLNYWPGTVPGTVQEGPTFDPKTYVAESQRRNVIETVARTIKDEECEAIFINSGATAIVPFVLPSVVAAVGGGQLSGLEYTFYVDDADGIRVTAAAGDTIRIGTSVSAAGGKIESTAIGSAVTLRGIDAAQWVALSSVGTWTVT